MKTLVNKANPAIRITAPEIETHEEERIFLISGGNYCNIDDWTLVEGKPTIVETIKEFVEKGKRCEQQAVEDNDQENYIFWQGFQNCAENILREVEEPTEGIKGNLEEIPSNVDLEEELKNKKTILLDLFGPMNGEQSLAIRNFARHFYELGLNARKKK